MSTLNTSDIYVRKNGDVYEVQFKYDAAVVAAIKQVPGRQWLPNQKMWLIPKDRLGWLVNELKGTRYENHIKIISDEQIGQNASLDVTDHIPDEDISDAHLYVEAGSEVLPHQINFMKFAIHRQRSGNMNGFLVADEQGLGKTLESMNLAMYNKERNGFKHCLVICCVNSSRMNWYADIFKHTNGAETPYILGMRKGRGGKIRYSGGSREKLEDLRTGRMFGKEGKLPYFLILNIEALHYKENRTYAITDAIVDRIQRNQIQMIIIDEIHKNASPTSKQGKQLLEIKKRTGNNAMWLPMTGTPITNSPLDLFVPLKLTNSSNTSSYYTWSKEYCIYGGFGDHEVIGYKNVPKLKVILQHNMIRRLKSDVLKLPPKIQIVEYVENTTYQARLYENVLKDVVAHKDEIVHSLNPMTQLLRLRQVNEAPELVDPDLKVDKDYLSKNARLARLLEILVEIHERGEKVLIYSNWVEPLRTLYKYISKQYKVCCFTGTMTFEERERHKKVFQTNPAYTIMIGTIGAMGTTHTLTAAQNVIFYDCPWTPSDKEQGEDRAHRIGMSTAPLNIYTLVTKDTIDERVQEILYTKKGISQFIVDGQLDIYNNPKLFDLLLSDQKYTY